MPDLHIVKKQGDFTVDTAFASPDAGVTALYGRSGAGKTSVVNMVAGLTRPDRGHIIVKHHVLFDSEKAIFVPPEKRRMGYIFQDGRLFPHLSVRANLTFGMRLTPKADRHVRFEDVVDLLGIGRLLHRRPAKLSGGEKQRVAIGRALLTSPALLLMDEPLASLDRSRKAEVLPFLSRLCGELSIPILYVSHSLNEILQLADHLVLLDHGKAAASGPVEDLMNRPDLQQLAGADGLGSVIAATVDGREKGLTRLRFPGGVLRVPGIPAGNGARVRVRIAARSVSLALDKPEGLSVQNILPGTVREIIGCSDEMADVRVDAGAPLIARITRNAVHEMGLEPGKPVFALVKSIAVSLGDMQKHPTCPLS